VHVAITPTGIGRTMRYLSRNDTLPTHFDPEVAFRRYLRTIAFTPRRNFRYGMLADSVGYLHLPTFAGEQLAAEVDSALVSLPFASTLIIDVRNNRGGSVDNAREIAGRFADASHVYGYRRLRDGPAHGDFTGFIEERVEPVGGRSYRGAVVVITNRRVFSSAEDFVLAMRALPNVTIVGDTTAGASGGPIVRELTNGWTYELSEWIEYTPERRTFEEIGLTPDIALKPTAADAAADSDPVLERAMLVATRQRVNFR
jgi:C-terminal processing protease CtpA/Prc